MLLEKLKKTNQDFEWYPTTQKMLDIIKHDLKYTHGDWNYDRTSDSKIYKNKAINILDCGAGDGRALKALAHGGAMSAIEKAKPLLDSMSHDIYIVGTEFDQTTLIDKEFDVVFSNPPYSIFEHWAVKLIKEANCETLYLIIPQRWKNNDEIKAALKTRQTKTKVLASCDFLDAERVARGCVDILKITYSRYYNSDDPFSIWFDEIFTIKADKEKKIDYIKKESAEKKLNQKVKELVPGRGLLSVLVELYNKDMQNLQQNILAICELDPKLLSELNVSVNALKATLKQRIKGLKNLYWSEYFEHFDAIKSRLTKASRKLLTSKLNDNTSIDFTPDNVYAVTLWAIKNANMYYDQQLVDLFENMIEKANIILYKSNKKTFGDEFWRFGRIKRKDKLERYSLELRIVMEGQGGISLSELMSEARNGLSITAHDFINDLTIIANNLGFSGFNNMNSRQWESGKKQEFIMHNGQTLMEIKAFKKGTLHIKFNQDFIRTLNVQFGKLKGWIKNKPQAMSEMNLTEEEISKCWEQQFKLIPSKKCLMICNGE